MVVRGELPRLKGAAIFIALLIIGLRLVLDLAIDALDARARRRAPAPEPGAEDGSDPASATRLAE